MGKLKAVKHVFQNWLQLKCKFLSKHKYMLENQYSEDLLKVQCKKCQKEFGVNLESAMIFAWDEDMTLLLSLYVQQQKERANMPQSTIATPPLKIVV